MTITPRQDTAKIYPFPLKAQTAAAGNRRDARPAVEFYPVVATDFGSGWYHEAAMQETQKGCKH